MTSSVSPKPYTLPENAPDWLFRVVYAPEIRRCPQLAAGLARLERHAAQPTSHMRKDSK